ncbi:hypothetical protein [Altererythrobacter sp.]
MAIVFFANTSSVGRILWVNRRGNVIGDPADKKLNAANVASYLGKIAH